MRKLAPPLSPWDRPWSNLPLSEELFYQLGLRRFNSFAKFRLEPAPPLEKLLSIAVDAEDGISRIKLTKEQVTEVSIGFRQSTDSNSTVSKQFIYKTLMDPDRREMLSEYFCLTITDEGLVQTLPLILRGYTPNLDKLPLLLMRLGPQVKPDNPFPYQHPLTLYYIPRLTGRTKNGVSNPSFANWPTFTFQVH